MQQLGNQIAYCTMHIQHSRLLLDGRAYQQIRDGLQIASLFVCVHVSLLFFGGSMSKADGVMRIKSGGCDLSESYVPF